MTPPINRKKQLLRVSPAPRDHYLCAGCRFQMGPWIQAVELRFGRRTPIYLCQYCADELAVLTKECNQTLDRGAA